MQKKTEVQPLIVCLCRYYTETNTEIAKVLSVFQIINQFGQYPTDNLVSIRQPF